MSEAVSPSTSRRYGLERVCLQWHVNRSTITGAQARETAPARPPARRGPKTLWSDEQLLRGIQWDLAATPWTGEGHRKVHARLRFTGVRASKDRILKIMRENSLLSPQRAAEQVARHAHDGTITTEAPDVMWGTDMTETRTLLDGKAYVFISVDHCTGECTGIHACERPNRFEALEPIRQGVREIYGRFEPGIATGLSLRHDNGTQYTSWDFQNEIELLGIEASPSYVRQPEGNGVAERFIRTLKENLLWIQHFNTTEELRLALHEFKDRYNHEWILERHGYQTPAQARATLTNHTTLEAAA